MSYENWKDKIGTFEVMDVRSKKMDFFPTLKAKAAALKPLRLVLPVFVAHAVILLSSLDKTRRGIRCLSPSPYDAQSP